jgi:hypothetical protein
MFATSADELLRFFRAEVGDAVAPYLWEDWEAYGYMTEGFDALLKEANVQTSVLHLPFVAGTPTVALPKSLLHIRTMRVVGGGEVTPASATARVSSRANDYGVPWPAGDAMFTGSGAPQFYVRDYERSALRLVPIPNAAGELELQGTVTLSLPLTDGAPLPTTDAEDLRLVLHYMKFLAYTKHEAETEDLIRSGHHERRFNDGAKERESRLRNYRRPPGVVRMEYP